jgi:polyisoprenoid-binding protein YceI
MTRFLAPLLALALSTPALAATWSVDPVHTQVGFSVTHMMVSTARGTFSGVDGTIEYDPANVAATKVTATIQVATIDTHNADRDTHLRSPDFFDAETYPTITFVSKGVRKVSKAGFELVGDLTMKGVTKEVVLKTGPISPAYQDPWGNTKVGTTATLVVNRQDYGVSWNKTLDQGGVIVGDEVTITLDLELQKKG